MNRNDPAGLAHECAGKAVDSPLYDRLRIAEIAAGVGDPQCYKGRAGGPPRFKAGDRLRVKDLPDDIYKQTPDYTRGVAGMVVSVVYACRAPGDVGPTDPRARRLSAGLRPGEPETPRREPRPPSATARAGGEETLRPRSRGRRCTAHLSAGSRAGQGDSPGVRQPAAGSFERQRRDLRSSRLTRTALRRGQDLMKENR